MVFILVKVKYTAYKYNNNNNTILNKCAFICENRSNIQHTYMHTHNSKMLKTFIY